MQKKSITIDNINFENDLGWVPIPRSIKDEIFYTDSNYIHLFVHILLKANRKTGIYKGIEIKKGQMLTGRKALSQDTSIQESKVERILNKLCELRYIEQQKTNKYRIITILYKDFLNIFEQQHTTNEQQATSNEQQKTQTTDIKNKEYKKEDKSSKKDEPFKISDNSLLEWWNDLASELGLSTVKMINKSRKQHFISRAREVGGVKECQRVLETKLKSSSFLLGDNDRGWKMDFDWMIKPANFCKILEGKYTKEEETQTTYNQEPYKERIKASLKYLWSDEEWEKLKQDENVIIVEDE